MTNGQAENREGTYIMAVITWEIVAIMAVATVAIAAAGAVGEYFMKYGKEQGIVKNNYEERENDSDKSENSDKSDD